jgi:hypothetical protein
VSYQGSSYLATSANSNQTPPAAPWQLMAQVGAQGPTGATGATGAQGPTGPSGAQGPQGNPGVAGVQGPVGPAGPGVPTGGATGQVLAKSSTVDYATQWVNQSGGTGTTAVTVFEQQAVTGSSVTLPQIPMANGVIEVAINGQSQLATRDWTIAGAVITFTTPLSSDDVHVEYQFAPFNPGQYASHFETTLTTGASTITLPQIPSGIPLLSRSGVVQYQSAGHYSLSGAVITLAVPIGASEDGRISIDYIAGGGTDAATVGGVAPSRLVANSNLLTNGGMELWQRGNGPYTANGAYTADRWVIGLNGTDAISVSRDTTHVDSGSLTCAACTYTAGSGANTVLWQVLKSSEGQQIAGRTLAVSIRVNANAANAVRVVTTGDGGSTTTYSSYHPGGSTYQTLTVTCTCTGTQTFLYVGVQFTASCTAYVDNAMLVVGSQPADYIPLTPADDLARCLRYYEHANPENGNAAFIASMNATAAAQNLRGVYFYKAAKAVTPTTTLVGTWTINLLSSQPGMSMTNTRQCFLSAQSSAAGDCYFYCASAGNDLVAEANP